VADDFDKNNETPNQDQGGSNQLGNLGKVIPVKLEEEMKTSYIDYAMSVIVTRARWIKTGSPSYTVRHAGSRYGIE
jgi:DNA gyrase subunit A